MDARSKTSNKIKDMQSKHTLHGIGRSGPYPAASISHHLDQPPADTRTIHEWLLELPAKFVDANEGVLEDLKAILLRYFKEVELIGVNRKGEVSVPEALEQLKRFQLWIDGERDLDRRLVEAPEVRKSLVSDLTGLVLLLRTGSTWFSMLKMGLLLMFKTGVTLFTPENQQALVDDTHRVVKQASQIALVHLKRSERCSPKFLEFIGATNIELKSRVDNLYGLLPTIQHLVNSNETRPRPIEKIGLDKRRPFDSGWRFKRLDQNIRRLLYTVPPKSDSSSSSQGAENSRRSHSVPSSLSKKQSHGFTDFPSNPSLFSDNGTHVSFCPQTNTITSTSPSETKKSDTEPTNSNSTRASSSCKDCRTTFSDTAELE